MMHASRLPPHCALKRQMCHFLQGLLEPDAPQELMSRAREALAAALLQAALRAAESAGKKHDCCRVPGCEHEHHHHEGHEQQQQQQQGQRGDKGGCGAQDEAACHKAGGVEKRSSKRSKRGDGSVAGAAGNDQSEAAAAAKGFSFNFDL